MSAAPNIHDTHVATEWLRQLFAPCEAGWITVFSIDSAHDRHTDWLDIANPHDMAAVIDVRAKAGDVWFGCATRSRRTSGRGGNEDCAQITSLWVDIDIAGPNHASDRLPPDMDSALAMLADFPLKPTAIVKTGGGIQAWWALAEPMDAGDARRVLARWRATWAQIAERRGWHLDNVFELARVMRLPGTTNRKNAPTAVRIAKADWSLRYGADDIDDPLIDPPKPAVVAKPSIPYIGPARPGDDFNARHTGADVLTAAGWEHVGTDRKGDQYFKRPGSANPHGAVVYADDGHTTIYSDAAGVPAFRPFDPFGLHAHLNHDGDWGKATVELREKGYGAERVDPSDLIGGRTSIGGEGDGAEPEMSMFIDWATFWATDHTAEEWLAFPLLPAHRQTAIYAPAKTGKSLLGLDVCLAIATGRPILGGEKGDPRHVMYLDYEMTDDDLKERILDLGYTEDDDLSYFHYSLQPPISSLDSLLGGQEVLFHAQQCKAELVVVDTFGRAVQGDENDADTVRAFYRFTGMTLKREGIALLRMDHSGKDLEKGQRGSSAKNDDVDVIWRATRSENGLTLQRTHSRVRWVPEVVTIVITDDPVLAHLADSKRALYAAGTAACADDLDALDVGLDASSRVAQAALKAVDKGRKRKVVCDALRFRKERLGLDLVAGTTPGTTLSTGSGNQAGTTEPKMPLTCDGTTWEPPGTTTESQWVVPPLSIAEPPRTSPTGGAIDDIDAPAAQPPIDDPDDW